MSRLILIVETSGRDASALQEQLQASRVSNPVRIVYSVAEAERYLNNEPPYMDRIRCPKPAVLFIDVGLPKLDRSALMRSLKTGMEWQDVLLVALARLADVTASQRAYAFSADSLLIKPCGAAELGDLIARFPGFWEQSEGASR